MTINQLECFVGAATCRSFSLAARKLYISQPNLSKNIEQLEKELGVILFLRSNKGVMLTREGVHLLNQATDILNRMNSLKDYYEMRKVPVFRLKISSQPISAVATALSSIWKTGVPVELHETNRTRAIQDVVNNKSELGIIMTSSVDPLRFKDVFEENHLEFNVLSRGKAIVYLNKNHPLAKNSAITPKELADYPQLKFNLDDYTENNTQNYSGLVSITNSIRYAKEVIKTTTTFITQTPWDSGVFRDENIVCRPLEDPSVKVYIGYCRSKDRTLSNRALTLIEKIRQIITE